MIQNNFNHVKINAWYCRLGNNIFQVKNAIHIALFYNVNIILPKHPFFIKQYITINNLISNNNVKSLTAQTDFFYIDKIKNIDYKCFELNHEKTLEILREIFIYPKLHLRLNDNDLVIHIRSGDIFIKPHPIYISSPYSYYENILKNNTFENVYLISENKLNPVIDKLLTNFPNITFKIQTLEQDISMILEAKNIVMDFGTFVPEIVQLSNNIINFYTSVQTDIYKYRNNINIININLEEYRKKMSPWKNTKEQIKYMLEN